MLIDSTTCQPGTTGSDASDWVVQTSWCNVAARVNQGASVWCHITRFLRGGELIVWSQTALTFTNGDLPGRSELLVHLHLQLLARLLSTARVNEMTG
jgi:hypothetical protein